MDNETLASLLRGRNRAGQPVDATANIIGPAMSALGNTIYGAGRGALTAMAGLPGDINQLITDNLGTLVNAQGLPTTKDIQDFLPLKPTSYEGKLAQKLGEFVPVNPTPIAKGAVAIAKPVGKAMGEQAYRMTEDMLQKEGLMPSVVPVGPNRIPSNEILFPNRTLQSLTPAEKSALTKFDKALANPAVRRRETLALEGQTILKPNIEMAERNIILPEQMQNKMLVPVVGDTSEAGLELSQIKGVPLARNVDLQGGGNYMRMQPNIAENRAWASEPEAATSKQNNLTAAGESGKDVLGVYTTMSPEGINFSHHVAEAMIGQLPVLKPSKTAISALNNEIQNLAVVKKNKKTGEKTTSYPYKNFAGVTSPNIYEQLANGTSTASAGNLRKAIVETMSKAEYRNMGFPRWEDVADAVITPELRNAPTGEAGYGIFQGIPEDPIMLANTLRHGSYSAGIPGKMVGGLENTIPSELMFPKSYAAQKAMGRDPTKINRSFMMSHQQELADQQWLDNIMQHLEKQKSGQ